MRFSVENNATILSNARSKNLNVSYSKAKVLSIDSADIQMLTSEKKIGEPGTAQT